MSRLRVGLVSDTLNARHSPTALVRANYLAAAASRIDSFWVSDHLNALMPRAIATPLPGTGWRGRGLAWV
jgi:phthiodiolone/phenolphthiodiolone dimycocerosates ketoreductase